MRLKPSKQIVVQPASCAPESPVRSEGRLAMQSAPPSEQAATRAQSSRFLMNKIRGWSNSVDRTHSRRSYMTAWKWRREPAPPFAGAANYRLPARTPPQETDIHHPRDSNVTGTPCRNSPAESGIAAVAERSRLAERRARRSAPEPEPAPGHWIPQQRLERRLEKQNDVSIQKAKPANIGDRATHESQSTGGARRPSSPTGAQDRTGEACRGGR